MTSENRFQCTVKLFASKRAQSFAHISVFGEFFRLLMEISDRLIDPSESSFGDRSAVLSQYVNGSKGNGKYVPPKKKDKKDNRDRKDEKKDDNNSDGKQKKPVRYVPTSGNVNDKVVKPVKEYIWPDRSNKEPISNRDKLDFLRETPNESKFKLPSIKKYINMKKNSDDELSAVQAHSKHFQKGRPGPSKRSYLGTDLGHIINSAYDNTVGYLIAKNQNRLTRKALKKNPDQPIVYLMNGIVVNEGSQHRIARNLKKNGMLPYHLPAAHLMQSKEKVLDRSYKRIEKLHKKAGISKEDARRRYDGFSGHSDGANFADGYLSNNYKTRELGIKYIQSRAGSPYGMEFKTRAQKALKYFVPKIGRENLKNRSARELAAKHYDTNPVIPVYSYAGERDKLVPPKYSTMIKEKAFKVFKGPNTSHIATSGASEAHSKDLANELKELYLRSSGKGNYYIRG